MTDRKAAPERVKTGVEGLDEILHGGLIANRLYLIEGLPGSGKTTLSLQFLLEGVRQGERVLYISLSETEEELRAAAASHDWSLDGVLFREFIPTEDSLRPNQQYTVFHPSEVELGETIGAILERSREVQADPGRLRFPVGPAAAGGQPVPVPPPGSGSQAVLRPAGVAPSLLIDDRSGGEEDRQLRSVASGIIVLEQLHPGLRLRAPPSLCRQAPGGDAIAVDSTTSRIRKDGLDVFPRPIALWTGRRPNAGPLGAGIAGLDTLLGGGIQRGTATLVAGPPGTGKSSLAVSVRCGRGRRGERRHVPLRRESHHAPHAGPGTRVPLEEHVAAGRVTRPAGRPGRALAGRIRARRSRRGAIEWRASRSSSSTA